VSRGQKTQPITDEINSVSS